MWKKRPHYPWFCLVLTFGRPFYGGSDQYPLGPARREQSNSVAIVQWDMKKVVLVVDICSSKPEYWMAYLMKVNMNINEWDKQSSSPVTSYSGTRSINHPSHSST